MNASLPASFLSLLPLVLGLAGAGPAPALTPYLVKDINPEARPDGSVPRNFVTLGTVSVFAARDGEAGTEPWVSDGTAAGTFLLADLCPGPCSSSPRFPVATGDGAAFFRAAPDAGSGALWVTRGTPASTFRLTEAGTYPVHRFDVGAGVWVAEQRLFYFTAGDNEHGEELWRTDGTPAGTFQVADIRPGPAGSLPSWLASFRGKVFFNADDGSGAALWVSDGTAQGTRLVKDAHPGSQQTAGPTFLNVIGTRLVFFFIDGNPGVSPLWSSDGTARGTVPLPGLDAADPQPGVAKTGRLLFFRGSDRQRGTELWATDGTVKGTRPVTKFSKSFPFASGNQPEAALGNRYVFLADDGVRGAEPWITDGTPAGTRLLRDICPGACSSHAFPRLAHGGRLFFEASNARGTELWMSDGTPAGTRLVKDICPGACSSSPRPIAAVGQRVLFGTTEGGHEHELWATNGTSAGTRLLTPSASDLFDEEPASGTIPGALLFSGADGIHGNELWRTDGTPAGTGLVADLATADLGGSRPCSCEPAGSRLLFFADDGISGKELWISDGTGGGTRLLQELVPGPGVSGEPYCPPFNAIDAAGQLFFRYATFSSSPSSLWRSDGTTGGTVALLDGELSSIRDLRALGPLALFYGAHSSQGTGLWRSDGTAAGTRLVRDVEPREPFVFQGRLFFGAQSPEEGIELWVSDGTTDGTKLVEDIVPGSSSSDPGGFVESAGRLYFFAEASSGGQSLWATDGTAAGTRAAVEWTGQGFQGGFAAADGNRLFVFGSAGALGPALWVTDGTTAGTRLVAQLEEEPSGAVPAVFEGSIWFSVKDSLWKSDGTAEGTGRVRDSAGAPVLNPSRFRIFAGRLFFLSLLDTETILFQSDGTEAGTLPVQVVGGSIWNGSFSADLETVGGRLFFPALDSATGHELWAIAPD